MYLSLWEAVERGELQNVRNLLTSGVSIEHDKLGETALIFAAKAGQAEVLEFLVGENANIEARGSIDYWTALIHAASKGHLDCVSSLIKAGANINYHAHSGTTALCEAAYNGHLSCVRSLVEAGAEINAPGDGGATAIEEAKKQGHSKIVDFLEGRNRSQQKKSEEVSDKNSQTLISELIEIGKTEKFISCRSPETQKYDDKCNHIRAREIGHSLDRSGGMQLMRDAHAKVNNALGAVVARELESAWGGIGDWWG
jgi:ankyrin repeat protein